jgi:hypothetical protein
MRRTGSAVVNVRVMYVPRARAAPMLNRTVVRATCRTAFRTLITLGGVPHGHGRAGTRTVV